jgi:hypothetical protein
MAKLNVSKWQAARRGPRYTPVMQFFWRQIRMAMFEALRVEGIIYPYAAGWYPDGSPMLGDLIQTGRNREYDLWDMAIMARAWIARVAPDPFFDRDGWLLSFDAACDALGCNADHERLWMLAKIDAAADFDTDEVWARIEYLTQNPPDMMDETDDFDAPRCVPVLDQGCLFGMEAT